MLDVMNIYLVIYESIIYIYVYFFNRYNDNIYIQYIYMYTYHILQMTGTQRKN